MRYRALSSTRDYTFGAKPGEGFLTDADAVTQSILTRLNLLLGEWWEDLDEGLPLFEEILVYNPQLSEIELVITERIALTSGVERVESASVTRDGTTRALTYSATVYTIYSEGGVSVSLGFDGTQFYSL